MLRVPFKLANGSPIKLRKTAAHLAHGAMAVPRAKCTLYKRCQHPSDAVAKQTILHVKADRLPRKNFTLCELSSMFGGDEDRHDPTIIGVFSREIHRRAEPALHLQSPSLRRCLD